MPLRVFQELNLSKCKEMFRKEHIGGVHLRDALGYDFADLLRKELLYLDNEGLFVRAPEKDGVAIQSKSSIYVGAWGIDKFKNPAVRLEDLKFCSLLAQAYTEHLFNPIAEMAGFKKIEIVNAVAIYKYPAEDGGISYHRDLPSEKDLIGVINPFGYAAFGVARSRDGLDEVNFFLEPGDIMLMRGHQGAEDIRPNHKAYSLGHDRYSIVFRNKDQLSKFLGKC